VPEIYNSQELRAELERFDHKFASHTDTEVLVHAYEQRGAEGVMKLRGMFAFGIWDQQKRRLFLARDRVVKKPLDYTDNGGCFCLRFGIAGVVAKLGVAERGGGSC
jgi:asparagine synthase (glutamine-hydrolysing)